MQPRLIFFICLVIFLFTFYQSDEDKARKLLNQAVVTWDKGDYEAGYALFETIHDEFSTTETATEAVTMFKRRLDKYKKRYSLRMNFAINAGTVSSEVLRQVIEFYKIHKAYPEKLADLAKLSKLKHSGYLQYCNYERAVANLGIRIDCTFADVKYAEINNQELKMSKRWNTDAMTIDTTIDDVFEMPIAKQLQAQPQPVLSKKSEWLSHRRVASVLPSDPPSLMPSGRGLHSFKPVTDDWGQRFAVRDNLPPNGFRALYFNTNNPETILHDTVTETIDVEFHHNERYGIESKSFGAYWVGELSIDKPIVKQFSMTLSRAAARLLINGREVMRENQSKQVTVALGTGVHLIEVELLNQWHTTEFNLLISEPVIARSEQSVKQYITQLDSDTFKPDLIFAGMRRKQGKGHVILDIAPSSSAIHLFLNAYNATHWVIENPHEVEIKSIVYTAYKSGSTISGAVQEDVPILNLKKNIDFFQDTWTCQCLNGVNTCEHDSKLSLKEAEDKLKQIYQRPLKGYSLSASSDYIQVPETMNDKHNRYRIAQNQQNNAQIAKTCNSNKNRDFGAVFSN